MIKRAEFTIPAEFSPPLRDLIQKILVANPLNRPSIKDIMAHPWVQPASPFDWKLSLN
jgi:serine/threonine protein kinase